MLQPGANGRLCSTSNLAKNPLEDRVDMLGMVAEIELLADLGFGERRSHFFVGKQFFKEISALFPHFHRISLDQRIALLAAETCLRKRQQNALRMD